MTYKVGDVVRLKSGGVPMCVTAYHPYGLGPGGNGTVSCTWLTATGEPKSYAFDERLVSAEWKFCPKCGSNVGVSMCPMEDCPITDVRTFE
jgi:uncharacterized protein YodC (DUF2158 family)